MQHEKTFKANFRFILSVSGIVLFVGIFSILAINSRMKEHALEEAKEKAMILLDRNIATHAYFSHQLKPVLFKKLKAMSDEKYFEPAWMSSTYAIREIDRYYHSISMADYYYKEAAINARSPENEADDFEKEFITKLNQSNEIQEYSGVRLFDGSPFFVVLRRGETMEESCLRCHSEPASAPQNLVDYYGDKRSFHRQAGEVVSAISIRIPLGMAYEEISEIITYLTGLSVVILLISAGMTTYLGKRWVYDPITRIRREAISISETPANLGVQIALPRSRELAELTAAFNSMSSQLKQERDQLEIKIEERTQSLIKANTALEQEIALRQATIKELESALKKIKTLSGLLPICSICKKIRDDQGYWNSIESYLHEHSDAELTHSICEDCLKNHYPDYDPS